MKIKNKKTCLHSEALAKGWRMVKLGEVVDVKMGQSPSSKFYNYDGKGLPFFQGVTDFGEKNPKRSAFCSEPIKIAE
jgi:type I restriction enzyme S subunit